MDYYTLHLKHEDVPLTGTQVEEILGQEVKLVPYHTLQNIGSINELLGEKKMCILLYEYTENNGHYGAIHVRDGVLEVWDSFGLSLTQARTRFNFGPKENFLQEIIDKSLRSGEISSYVVNSVDFQSHKSSSQVCGRYAAFRLLHTNERLKEFNTRLKGVRRHMPTDDFITLLTDLKVNYNKNAPPS